MHIHKCLGKLALVREQYATQRGLQLKADLDPPADFLGSYQTYIAQIVGFFVIEERVGRLGHEGIGAQADVGWSRAMQRLATLLDGSVDAATSADTVLVVKDFLQLAITALGTHATMTSLLPLYPCTPAPQRCTGIRPSCWKTPWHAPGHATWSCS